MLSPRNCSKHCQRRRSNYGTPIFLRYTSVYRFNSFEKSHVIGAIVLLVKDFDGHGSNWKSGAGVVGDNRSKRGSG